MGFRSQAIIYLSLMVLFLVRHLSRCQHRTITIWAPYEMDRRTSIEEAVSMQMVDAAGIPVPKVLCYGEHLDAPFNRRVSILMTRLPGITLENTSDPLQVDDEEPWLEELNMCVHTMRCWRPPSQGIIASPIGTSLRSTRVPLHIMGPFVNQAEFYEYLVSAASDHAFESTAEYEETLARANKLRRDYRIMFTHGDFKAHNILVGDDGHLSGFLDWESAGWYPEYWEFTTAMRFGRRSWWYQVASWIGGDKYSEELDADVGLNLLAVECRPLMGLHCLLTVDLRVRTLLVPKVSRQL